MIEKIQICEIKFTLKLYLEGKTHVKLVLKLNRVIFSQVHGETFYINFYYCIFQFREKHITLRIFVTKNTKLYNNDMKLQHS